MSTLNSHHPQPLPPSTSHSSPPTSPEKAPTQAPNTSPLPATDLAQISGYLSQIDHSNLIGTMGTLKIADDLGMALLAILGNIDQIVTDQLKLGGRNTAISDAFKNVNNSNDYVQKFFFSYFDRRAEHSFFEKPPSVSYSEE